MPVATSPLGVDLDYSDKVGTQRAFLRFPHLFNTERISNVNPTEIEDFFLCLYNATGMDHSITSNPSKLKVKS